MRSEKFKELERRKIQLFSKLRLRNIFPGEWESIYKGPGFIFADIKTFQSGDDPRRIDLKSLAERRGLKVVQRITEKQLKVHVWVDFSASFQELNYLFFPSKPEIRDIAIGLFLFSAVKIYSPIGFTAFSKRIKKNFPAKMGEDYCDKITDWIKKEGISLAPESADFSYIIPLLAKITPSQSLVCLISDFQDEVFERDFVNLLKPLVQRFDFIPIVIRDPLEKDFVLKKTARITIRDSEKKGKGEIYLTPQKLKEIQEVSQKHLLNLERNFKKLGIDFVVLDSPSIDDCARTLSNFFQARRKAGRRRF